MSTKKEILVIGLEFISISNVRSSVVFGLESGYKRFYIPITHPRYRREFTNLTIIDSQGDNCLRSLIAVHPYPPYYLDHIIGKLSDYWNLDSTDENSRQLSETSFDREVDWCIYLGMKFVMVYLPTKGSVLNLARYINSKLNTVHKYKIPVFTIRLPMISFNCISAKFRGDTSVTNDSWERWNEFRMCCNSGIKIKVALEISTHLPGKEEIDRWLGEPVACVILNTEIFLKDQTGYPVLPIAHLQLINQILKKKIQIVISGAVHEQTKIYQYQQYIHNLWQSQLMHKKLNLYHGYEDYLQIPFQPLKDNLSSSMFEMFEKDPVKYKNYQSAISLILSDKKVDGKNQPPIVIMVVGAGRGPLVNACLNASNETNVPIKIYAVEKNQFAVASLQYEKLKQLPWQKQVTIISSDIKHWKSPEMVDIIVSEIVASFGDNELALECLNETQKFLKKDGIMIPCQYSSYICPTQTHKIYSQIIENDYENKTYYQRFEQPYFIDLQTVYHISPLQKLFTFVHPNKDETKIYSKYALLTFEVEQNCVLHGFSRFYDIVLYKDIKLSLMPEICSQKVFCEFPLFFPIKEPIYIKKGEKIELAFWRLNNGMNVWYEWLVSSPGFLSIHNPNGRSYSIEI